MVAVYQVASAGVFWLLPPLLQTEIFPAVDAGQFQLRLRAPAGTRIARTELIALRALDTIKQQAGADPCGDQHRIHRRTAGELSYQHDLSLDERTERSRPLGGADTNGRRTHAAKIRAEPEKIPELRDLQYAQPLDYPTIDVKLDRERAGQLGLSAASIARSLVAATSSSRFIEPSYWRDPDSGNEFQIQVEIPQNRMKSMEDVVGEIERYNMQRVVSLTANIHEKPLGSVAGDISAAIRRAGDAPRGTSVSIRGQIPPLPQTVSGLRVGLLLSIAVIFSLLATNFQSVRLALAVISTVTAVLCGVAIMRLITGTTLNVQSFMGAIMSIGIAVANAILLVTFADMQRKEGERCARRPRMARADVCAR